MPGILAQGLDRRISRDDVRKDHLGGYSSAAQRNSGSQEACREGNSDRGTSHGVTANHSSALTANSRHRSIQALHELVIGATWTQTSIVETHKRQSTAERVRQPWVDHRPPIIPRGTSMARRARADCESLASPDSFNPQAQPELAVEHHAPRPPKPPPPPPAA